MTRDEKSRLPAIVRKNEKDILDDWIRLQLAAVSRRSDLINEGALRDESRTFLAAFVEALQRGASTPDGKDWDEVRAQLDRLSRSRAHKGFSPTETATFVFSLKEPLFTRLRDDLSGNPAALAEETWQVSTLLDKLGLVTTEAYQKSREEVISRQQQEMLELSTPVVSLWDGIVALPLIGTLDSARTQVVMETLLQRIVEKEAAIAIIDITGVPTVDTLVAQHLLKAVAAARLMGADCIISGIRPQIAQTIVHLGVTLGEVTTKATLADAFALALTRTGLKVVRASTGS
ncbi:MAG TPA: STAS domain-containing protein [Thermoanaerobaculia bacterium]|nr:STAS domain-containing protein [Thermoanaerobaculia bacterium]